MVRLLVVMTAGVAKSGRRRVKVGNHAVAVDHLVLGTSGSYDGSGRRHRHRTLPNCHANHVYP